MKRSYPVFLLMLLLLCSNCSNAQKRQVAQVLPTDAFEQKMHASLHRIVLDVRTPDEFASGHLQNAVNINLYDDDFLEKVGRLDTTKTVFVYCLGGGRSGSARQKMATMGFDTIYDLKNGVAGWNAAGKKLEAATKNTNTGMSKAEFLKKTNHGDTLVIVDFNAPWCMPCKKIKAYMPNIQKRFGDSVIFVDIDYDSNRQLASELSIYSIPFLIFMKNGEYVLNVDGYLDEEMMRNDILKYK